MIGSAPTPADELALRKLKDAAREYAAAVLKGVSRDDEVAALKEAALAYAQAVKDARRARRTKR